MDDLMFECQLIVEKQKCLQQPPLVSCTMLLHSQTTKECLFLQ